MNKPIPLRAIFILYALKIPLAFVIYGIVTSKEIDLGGIEYTWILYTAFAYIATFAALVFCILRKNLLGLRAVIGIDFLISLPVKAIIGLAFAAISFGLSFHSKVKAYFQS